MNRFQKIARGFRLVFLIPAILVIQGFGNPTGADESAVKAMFIYNFTKYFDWSEIASRPDFVIAVYGNTPVTAYLSEIAHRKTVNGQSIVIKTVTSMEEIYNAQMLFIPENKSGILESLNDNDKLSSLILISESRNGLKQGAHINLINLDGKLRFELNETKLKYNFIKYSRELTSLAYSKN